MKSLQQLSINTSMTLIDGLFSHLRGGYNVTFMIHDEDTQSQDLTNLNPIDFKFVFIRKGKSGK